MASPIDLHSFAAKDMDGFGPAEVSQLIAEAAELVHSFAINASQPTLDAMIAADVVVAATGADPVVAAAGRDVEFDDARPERRRVHRIVAIVCV